MGGNIELALDADQCTLHSGMTGGGGALRVGTVAGTWGRLHRTFRLKVSHVLALKLSRYPSGDAQSDSCGKFGAALP
jgi:hypothetical protein